MGVTPGRRTILRTAPILLAVLAARKPARAEDVALHPAETAVPVTPPAALPDLAFTTLAGTHTSLKAFAGKPIVLNFWATWCIPCVAELPELDQLASQPDVTVLAVSADRTGAAAVKPFLSRHPLAHATLLLDPQSDSAHAVQILGFPTTLILDAQTRLRARLEGPAAWGHAMGVVAGLTR